MVAPVLLFAIGNESRGDDAQGPLLLRELNAYLVERGLSGQVELLEEYQLQIEHAIDMQGRELVLFIDAGMDTEAPFTFSTAKANDVPMLYSHALAPEALLKVYTQLYQEKPPAVFILCIRGERFELGEGLSPQAEEHLELALAFSKKLLMKAEIDTWNGLLN